MPCGRSGSTRRTTVGTRFSNVTVTRFVADVLADNHAMLAVFADAGFDVDGNTLDGSPYMVNKAGFTQHAYFHKTLGERASAICQRYLPSKKRLFGAPPVTVVVGDEVLDTSVKARLEQMRVALTA